VKRRQVVSDQAHRFVCVESQNHAGRKPASRSEGKFVVPFITGLGVSPQETVCVPAADQTAGHRDRTAVAAAIELLAETFPACFSVYEGRRRPLNVGIHHDIRAMLDGAITPVELGKALRAYVSNGVYRRRLVAGAVRIDLNGQPAGVVTPEQVAPPRPRTKVAPLVNPRCGPGRA
jgi:hypothetical protein